MCTVCTGDDGTIHVWDLGSGAVVREYSGHTGAVRAMCCSSDGTLLVSAASDQTLRVWNLNTTRSSTRIIVVCSKHSTFFISLFTSLSPSLNVLHPYLLSLNVLLSLHPYLLLTHFLSLSSLFPPPPPFFSHIHLTLLPLCSRYHLCNC